MWRARGLTAVKRLPNIRRIRSMTADRQTGDLGRKLREARERKGVSLREIANATKISVGMLEALERNDIKRLPGGIFGRAFVRLFATEVGLDPEATIQEFIAQFRDDSGHGRPSVVGTNRRQRRRRKRSPDGHDVPPPHSAQCAGRRRHRVLHDGGPASSGACLAAGHTVGHRRPHAPRPPLPQRPMSIVPAPADAGSRRKPPADCACGESAGGQLLGVAPRAG